MFVPFWFYLELNSHQDELRKAFGNGKLLPNPFDPQAICGTDRFSSRAKSQPALPLVA